MVSKDGHTFIPDLMTPGGWVLDIGCRGFLFARAMTGLGMKVLCFDPDMDITDPGIDNVFFENKAVTEPGILESAYAHYSTGQGNYLTDANDKTFDTYTVECTDIKSIMTKGGIGQFELIKIDCEGSEYKILMSLPDKCTKQISVEFHDFMGKNPYPSNYEKYYTELRENLSDYTFFKHECTALSETNDIQNYWDSLFILKGEL